MTMVKSAKITNIIFSAVYAAIGLAFVVYPWASLRVVCILAGAACLPVGISKLLGYFSNDLYRRAFQFDLALGVFTLLLGLLFLFSSVVLSPAVLRLAGAYVFIESLLKLQTALDARRFGLKHWLWMTLSAVVAALLGLGLLLDPFLSGISATLLLGLALTVSGVTNICITAYTVRIKNARQAKETED